MAEIVLGIGSSHAPQLALPPDQWWRRGDWDRHQAELWYQGRPVTFAQLAAERADERFEREITPEKCASRFDACQRAIGVLAETIERVAPDVAVIVGDDQHECFVEDNMPSIGVYWGDTVDTAPPAAHSGEGTQAPPALSRFPQVRTANPCAPDLGRHLIQYLIGAGFDPAHSRRLPAGRHGEHAIGHAFSYVYRRLMNDRVIPNVPIYLNTYYPPNQPSLRRCYQLGLALRRAIAAWDGAQTVALIASGGFTHFVIEEDLDRRLLGAFEAQDEATLTGLPAEWFNSGNSEIRNWIVLAGAMAEGPRRMHLVDYVPCYRTEAGTGCAMAFARWE
jgi:hypothetical protein